MKLETFFEKFEQLADVPNAVAKMRELVLHLAASGKLVEHCSDDEPASDLVNRIENHFELLRSRNQLRFFPLTPLEDADLPALPRSWQWVRLGNVVVYGSPAKAESASIPADSWLLDLEDIEKDTSRLLQRKTFRDSPSKSTKTAFEAGDVLYGKLRPYLNKVLVAEAPGYCTTEIIPIRTFGFIEPAYLCYALKRPEFLAYAVSKSYGMNLPRLGTSDARNAAFPLPPLAEQKRIVTKADELMALCDRMETQQQERDTRHAALARASLARFADAPTPANLDYLFHNSYAIAPSDLRKTILALAVQGRLVSQDAKDEAADQLIVRLVEDRERIAKEQGVRLPKNVPAVDINRIPHDIPDSWQWERIGRLAVLIDYGTSQKANSDSANIPVYRMGNIVGGKLVEQNLKYVEPSIDDLPGLYLKTDDILFNRTNSYELVGKAGIFRGSSDTCTFASYLIRIRMPVEHLYPSFINLAMNAPYFRQTQIEPEITQQCGQANFNGTKLALTLVPIPPLAEQCRIVAKVDQLMALVDQLEAQFTASRATATNLMEAIVAELTGQE